MQIIETTFNNFRYFKDYSLKYGTQTTVIIGKNGTGKSSILSGLRRGLSFMFAKPKKYSFNLATSNIATVKTFSGLEFNFDPILRKYNTPLELGFKAKFQNSELKWSFVKEKISGSGLKTKYYESALNEILNAYNLDPLFSPLPVLALYADSFPHDKMNIGPLVKKIIQMDILPRDFAYYGWIDKTNSTELWLNRFYKVSDYENDRKSQINETIERLNLLYSIQLEEPDDSKSNKIHNDISRLQEKLHILQSDETGFRFQIEKKFIEDKFLQFTSTINQSYNFINQEFELYRISTIKLDGKNNSLQFLFKDGRSIAFETLPMGYKRIFSIVLDLAYRCFILNEESNSQGIAMIDEIELHLHPSLQQEILQRLKNTFPDIQFIVTTHSPLVISNFKSDENNKIIKLENDGNSYWNTEIDDIFGIDYITSLSVMNSGYRSSTIDKLIDMYVALKARDNQQEAEKIYNKLKVIFNGEPNKLVMDEIESKLKSYS